MKWSESESEGDEPQLDNVNDSGVITVVPSEDSSVEGGEQCSKDWLLEHVSVPYWEDRYQTLGLTKPSTLAHPSCTLAEQW